MKNSRTLILLSIILILIVYSIIKIDVIEEEKKIEWQLFTGENLYLITDLQMRNQNDNKVITFNSKEEMAVFLAELTKSESHPRQKIIWNDDLESIPTVGSLVKIEHIGPDAIYIGPKN